MENFSCTDGKVHQNKIQETPTAGDDPNQEQDQDVAKQKTIDNPQETPSGPLVQDQSDEENNSSGWSLANIIATLLRKRSQQPGIVLSPPHQASFRFGSAGDARYHREGSNMAGRSNVVTLNDLPVATRFEQCGGASYHREGSNMAGGSNVVTLNDLPVPTPFEQCGLVRMKLENRAKGEIPDEPEPEAVKEAKAGIEDIFVESSESNLNLEESYEQEAMEQHEKQLDEIFDGIHQRIEMLRIDVKKKFRTLTLQQKKQVLKFWLMVEEFLDVLLKYIRTRFDDVLERIRRGYKIDRHAIKKIFNYIIEFLKAIF